MASMLMGQVPTSNPSSRPISRPICRQKDSPEPQISRREVVLRSSEMATLAAIFHFRNYNPQDGRKKKTTSRDEAMAELLQVVESIKPDNFSAHVVEKKEDYVRVEYESPIMGFVDDVEFWFPPGSRTVVEYRSASRLGNFDFDINRKRIKALRSELEKKGWASETDF
ncbi:uncharacterized protein LOC103697526 isoform X3 [Phoenix dactylifera]|uniref:Uncharacterized protein LOC103697526 isoform X3 n=1 Tax=Phoenix dactylifera TaxID=42345 RepID=A0A8B8ZSJ2_PHODC|nr:uncharacterized protein LOC103697526 isoform X3 [Phoenix dactylifera]